MKKKIYFIISALFQIILSIYILINCNQIIESQLKNISEVYSAFPTDFQERIVNILQSHGTIFINITSCISIIINLFILKIVLDNKILKNKRVLIILSAICFFTSETSLGTIFSIINLIIIATLKTENTEEHSKTKKKLPPLEYKKASKKELILSIILLIAYFSQFLIDNLLPENRTLELGICISIITYIILLILAIFTFKDKLLRDLRAFKENAKSYIGYVLPKLAIMYIIFIFTSLICVAITKETTSINQATLEALPMWFIAPIALIWAPIVEELIFRGVFRRFIKNDIIYILISAIVFGLLHTISELTVLNTLVMAIPYSILGGFFAYIYAKTDNLTNNMLAHAFNNLIALAMSLISTSIILL